MPITDKEYQVHFRLTRFSLTMIAAIISGCAVTTEPLDLAQSQQRAQSDLSLMFKGQEPVIAPITLHEAMARALKYNLEGRLKVQEEALAQKQLNLTSFDMLPKLAMDAGYVSRSNTSASSSQSIESGQQSLEPSTSLDNNRRVGDLTMVWNVLDFGVSYVTAQQQADQGWIAQERRRKVIHTIIQDVRSAYWRAVAAERLLGRIDGLLGKVNMAREASQNMTKQQVGDPIAVLSYQRALLEATRQLEEQHRALSLAKTELASLMNLPLNTDYQLAMPDESAMAVPELKVDLARLEETALISRPELREQDYQARISAAETRKAMLRMLPGLEFSAGGHYDSNSFLVNQSWADAGMKVTWNLFNVLSGPAAQETAEAGQVVAETRRQAMSMAILAQLYVAKANFNEAARQYQTSNQLQQLDSQIAEQLQNRFKTGGIGELEVIQSELNALSASLHRDLAYADLRNAYGQLFATVGLDPLAKPLASGSLANVSQALQKTEQEWDQGKIVPLQAQ
jgi:outer membrane protein TolC